MSVNAPIHDMLIRIKNAYMARRREVKNMTYSRFVVSVLELLKEYHFIQDFSITEDTDTKQKLITVTLKEVTNPIQDIPVIKFYSKPSRRWYVKYKDIKPVAGGQGIGILTTSKGLMPSHKAKKMKIGGELIAEIY